MRRIDVTIDRLVLRGLDPADRHGFVDGLRTELSRVLDGHDGLQAGGSRRTPLLRLGQMQMDPGPSGARKLGGGIAGAIGKGLRR
jgi:hypothetical protein